MASAWCCVGGVLARDSHEHGQLAAVAVQVPPVPLVLSQGLKLLHDTDGSSQQSTRCPCCSGNEVLHHTLAAQLSRQYQDLALPLGRCIQHSIHNQKPVGKFWCLQSQSERVRSQLRF